jgi:hypothetical protein
MKRKLLLGSAVVPALLASSAMGQVVNFMDVNNVWVITPAANFNNGAYYCELFAGQGAYSDPGNNIWNGFANNAAYFYYQSYDVYGGDRPQQPGNPGNPYAAFNSGTGWITSDGPDLFTFTGSPTNSGDCDSTGTWTQITLGVTGYFADTTIQPTAVPNGPPVFLFSMAAHNGPYGSAGFTLQNVPPGTYGLYLYGASPENNGGTAFSVSSGSAHNGIAATLNSGATGAPPQTYVEGQNFVIFENVTPDASSNIVITAVPNPLNGVGNSNLVGNAYVNGFQLIFHPPPTAQGMTAAQNVYAGGTASFSFTPVFATSPTFQWQSIIGGVTNNISGATTTNLTIANVGAANVGLYQCVITTATATNTSPAAPLTILTFPATGPLQTGDPTSLVGYILQLGDNITDTNNNIDTRGEVYDSVPPPFNMTYVNVEDNTLFQYVNLGSGGDGGSFSGPVGIIVTPNNGATVVTGIRFFASSSHPEDDPADYLLQGSTNGGTNLTFIAGGLLAIPPQRNAAGGPINITNQVLQEITFANTAAYTTYMLTFTNVNNDTVASNGLQVAEIQLLGSFPPVPPGILLQFPTNDIVLAGATLNLSVVASGPGPVTYQWYYNTATVPNATNAAFTLSSVQVANAGNYYCVISNPHGATNSVTLSLTVISPSVYESAILADKPVAFYPLNESSGITAYDLVGGYDGTYTNAPTFDAPGPSSFIPEGVTFDGMSQYVLIPNSPALDFANEITLEAWVQPDTNQPSGNLADIIAKGYDSGQNTDEMQLRVQDSTYFDGGYYNGVQGGGYTAGGVVTTNWSHVVLTGDGADWNLYQNGVLVDNTPASVTLVNFSDPWAIANGTANGNGRLYGGNISAAAIYNYALTPSQVSAHYNIGKAGTTNVPPFFAVPSAPVTNTADLGGSNSISSTAVGPPTITYQWYYATATTTNLIAGATNATLVLTNIQAIQSTYDYFAVASNPYGSGTSAVVTLNILSGAPTLVADVSPLLVELPSGLPVTFSVSASGTEPFTYQWSSGGSPIAGATSSSYSFDALLGSNTYSVVISSSLGHVSSSTAVVIGLPNPPPSITFNVNGTNWTLNQGPGWPGAPTNPCIVNGLLTLTDGTNGEACSAFYDFPQYIGGFTASYIYKAGGNRGADGTVFCLQNSGGTTNEVGDGGGDLGFYGITNSAGFEINLYTGSSGGAGIQFGTNGSTPDSANPIAAYFYPGFVNYPAGDPTLVQLIYITNVLTAKLTDQTTGALFTTNFDVNLEAAVGGSSAYIGFTGGDGGANSIQQVSDFVFSYYTGVTLPVLSIVRGTAGSVVISWPVQGSTSFVLQQSAELLGPWSTVSTPPVVSGTVNEVTLTPGATTFYRLVNP